MARLFLSFISRRHQDDDDQHDHGVLGQRVSSPDYVDVEITHSAGAVLSR